MWLNFNVTFEILITATTFDQEALNVVDESTLSPAEAAEYADTANCGMTSRKNECQ